METIQLYNTPKGWIAVMLVNGAPDKTVANVFGTHHLPTAFTNQASYETVKAALAKLNPNATISLS